MSECADNVICCFKCKKSMRPPFKTCRLGHLVCCHCKTHKNSNTDNADYIDESINCCAEEFELPELNKLFKYTLDFCQYDCGFRSTLLEIAQHEKICSRQDKYTYCAIADCLWKGVVSKLISHVEDNHAEHLRTISTQGLKLKMTDPVVLVTQFNKSNIVNEVYWLRVLENENTRYVMLMYLGRTVPEGIADRPRLETYYITSSNNDTTSVRTAVVNNTGNYDDRITNNSFMVNKGTNISILNGESLIISADNPTAMTVSENILSLLECVICLEVLHAPIRQCEIGHSYCGRCAEKLKICPSCRNGIFDIRNYSMEKMCESFYIACKNQETGCNVSGSLGKMALHDKVCKYQMTTCLERIGCNWRGTYNDMFNHWHNEHDMLLKPNGSTVVSDGRYWYLYYVAGNFFVYAHTSDHSIETYYISVHHLTNQTESDFFFDLEFSHPVTGQSFSFSRPCQASTAEQTKNEDYLLLDGGTSCKVPWRWFDEIVRHSNSEFSRTLKIYRKQS